MTVRLGQGHGCKLPEVQQGDRLTTRLKTRASLHHWHGEDFPSARGFEEVTKFSLCPEKPTAALVGGNELLLLL